MDDAWNAELRRAGEVMASDLAHHWTGPRRDPIDIAAHITTMRASLDAAADLEVERVRARSACPPHRAVTYALDVLLSAYERLEHWSTARCLARYRQMRPLIGVQEASAPAFPSWTVVPVGEAAEEPVHGGYGETGDDDLGEVIGAAGLSTPPSRDRSKPSMYVQTTRTITLGFETEEQAERFDAAMTCGTAKVPAAVQGVRYDTADDGEMDLALAIEYLAARAINARPFSGNGDPDAFSAKVEIQ